MSLWSTRSDRPRSSVALSPSVSADSTVSQRRSSAPRVSLDENILNAACFHGRMPRSLAQRFLKVPGDFLLRQSDHCGVPTITVRTDSKEKVFRHYQLIWNDTERCFVAACGAKFTNTADLISHFKEDPRDIGSRLIREMCRLRWELDRESLLIDLKPIGHGQFGQVHKATFTVAPNVRVPVAVKMCRQDATAENADEFFAEAELTGTLWHPNIARFIGIAVKGDPLMLVLEWCDGGSLEDKVKKNPNLSYPERLGYALQAAMGMEYLHYRNLIHRDLAARNCLLRENGSLAVADFGMSRKGPIVQGGIAKGAKLPIRWSAPESLLPVPMYSQKSDVWSYGVLLWEIWSNGKKPYGMVENLQQKIATGALKLSQPTGMPQGVTKVMLDCHYLNADKRLPFKEVVAELKRLQAITQP